MSNGVSQGFGLDTLIERAGCTRQELITTLADHGEDYRAVLNGDWEPTLVEATFLAALLKADVSAILGNKPAPTALICTTSGCRGWQEA